MFKKLIKILKSIFTIKVPSKFSLDDLPISKRELNYLQKANIDNLETLLEFINKEKLTTIKRIGPKTQLKIQKWLKEKDIR